MAGPLKVAGPEGQVVCWMVPNKAIKSGWEHRSATRGEIIDDLPDSEAERLGALLIAPDAPLPDTASAETGAFSPVSDDDLSGMTVEQIHAYVGQVPEDQHDDEVARIVDLEQQRSKPRTSVLSLDPDFEAHPDDELQS